MGEEECEDGIFQFGHSVGFNDEMRRTAVAETEEIEKASSQLSNAINLEEKLRVQSLKDRSHAAKEMDGFLRTRKEALERLAMDSEVLRGLAHTLSNQFSTNNVDDSIESNDSRSEEGFDNVHSLLEMKHFIESASKKAITFRDHLKEINQNLLSQAELVGSLNNEAEVVEKRILSQGLESSLEKSRESTSSKRAILEELKTRLASAMSYIESSENRLQRVEEEVAAMNHRLASKQKEADAELASGKTRLAAELQEKNNLEEVSRQLQKRKVEVMNELESLKDMDTKLASFIKAKEESTQTREYLRLQRNQLYASKKEKEKNISEAKDKLDIARCSFAEAEKKMEEVQKMKLGNDSREVEVLLLARKELGDIDANTKNYEDFLLEARKRSEKCSFIKEKERLAQLRSKHENIQKDIAAKTAQLQQILSVVEEEEKQSEVDLASLRGRLEKAEEMLNAKRKHLDLLKEQKYKRLEMLRKLEVLRYGANIIRSSKLVERELGE